MLTRLLQITGLAFATLVMLVMLLTGTILAIYWEGALSFLIGT